MVVLPCVPETAITSFSFKISPKISGPDLKGSFSFKIYSTDSFPLESAFPMTYKSALGRFEDSYPEIKVIPIEFN